MLVTEYMYVRNTPTELSLTLATTLSANRAEDEVFKRCRFADMQQSAESSSSDHYLIQPKMGEKTYTEADISRAFDEIKSHNERLQKKMLQKEARGHVHNLNGKAVSFMYRAFHTSVLEQLSVSMQLKVQHCLSFQEFSETLEAFGTGTPNYKAVLEATKKFCTDYDATPFFWKQAGSLKELNTTRNKAEHCSVAASATALSTALEKLEEQSELKPAAAMLDALVSYSQKHAPVIDQAALEEHKQQQQLLAALQAKQQARKQRNDITQR